MPSSQSVVLFSSDDGVLYDMTIDGRAGEYGLLKEEFDAAQRRRAAYPTCGSYQQSFTAVEAPLCASPQRLCIPLRTTATESRITVKPGSTSTASGSQNARSGG